MLVYERIQTLIGREIGAYELSLLAGIFRKSMDFFGEEESTEPWKVDPAITTYHVSIVDVKLADKIFDIAKESGIDTDELILNIVKEYADRQEVACNE